MLLVAEFVLVPVYLSLAGKPDRELSLLGMYGEPGTTVDDVRINSQGFTGDVLESARSDPDAVRILILGGSAIFLHSVTERLKEELAPLTSAPLEIQGGALPTHTTRSSLIKYRQRYREYDFDFVIIYHAINDLWMNNVDPQNFRADYSHRDPWYRRNALLNNSLIARWIYNEVIWQKPRHPTGAAGDAALPVFAANIRELVELVREDGAKPVLMSFAWNIPDDYTYELFQGRKLGYRAGADYESWPVELWGEPASIRVGMLANNAKLREIAADTGIDFIEQDAVLSPDISLFGDVCHLNERGSTSLTANIVDYFKRQQLLPD